MKKITVVQAGFIAAGTLSLGLFIGLWIAGVFPADNSTSGTFAKAEKYRKVTITEKDILLRNDLLGDTAGLSRYQKYLSYFYFKSLQTSVDLEKAIAKCTSDANFHQNNDLNSLNELKTYLESARSNLLKGVAELKTLKENEHLPLRDDLINARNTISRINNQNRTLLDFLTTVETYLSTHSDQPHQSLKDAHDLLVVNVLQTALITKDKPLLKYLGDMKFYNDLQEMKALLMEVQLNAEINDKVVHDKTEISGLDENDIQHIVVSIKNMDNTFGREILFNQMGIPLQGTIQNKAEKIPLPDLGEIIRIQDQVIQAFAATEMQGILNQALSNTCRPYCVTN